MTVVTGVDQRPPDDFFVEALGFLTGAQAVFVGVGDPVAR